MYANTHLVDAEKAGRWRVRVGGLHLVLPPYPELSSSMTGLLSLCTREQRGRDNDFRGIRLSSALANTESTKDRTR